MDICMSFHHHAELGTKCITSFEYMSNTHMKACVYCVIYCSKNLTYRNLCDRQHIHYMEHSLMCNELCYLATVCIMSHLCCYVNT